MTVQAALEIPFANLSEQHRLLRREIHDAIDRVLDHGQFILGPEVETLEKRWAEICGVRHAIGVASGTDALMLSLRVLGIGPGDEVITAPNSFVASASAIAMTGASPRFADVGDDFNIDPQRLERAITERTRAVIPVHLTGRPARMAAISEVARDAGIHVVEDAAQAMGATLGGRPVGSFGELGCFSLHPLKTIGGCGDGGMITTDDDNLAAQLRLLRNHGIQNRQEDCRQWGFNSRLDTIQAAIVNVKLDYLNAWTSTRRSHAAQYRELLGTAVRVPTDQPEVRATYTTFIIEADRRDDLADHLLQQHIACKVHYAVPIHLLDAAQGCGYQRGAFPTAERQAERILSLPIHESLDEAAISRVCEAILSFYGA